MSEKVVMGSETSCRPLWVCSGAGMPIGFGGTRPSHCGCIHSLRSTAPHHRHKVFFGRHHGDVWHEVSMHIPYLAEDTSRHVMDKMQPTVLGGSIAQRVRGRDLRGFATTVRAVGVAALDRLGVMGD